MERSKDRMGPPEEILDENDRGPKTANQPPPAKTSSHRSPCGAVVRLSISFCANQKGSSGKRSSILAMPSLEAARFPWFKAAKQSAAGAGKSEKGFGDLRSRGPKLSRTLKRPKGPFKAMGFNPP